MDFSSRLKVEDFRRRSEQIGTLVGWIQSLEFNLRYWLLRAGNFPLEFPDHVGQKVQKTPMTDYRSLGQLIAAYNGQLSEVESKYRLSTEIVAIRDAVAHGRVLALSLEGPLTIYCFGPPKDGVVETTAMRPMTPEGLSADIDLLREQWILLHDCGSRRGYVQ